MGFRVGDKALIIANWNGNESLLDWPRSRDIDMGTEVTIHGERGEGYDVCFPDGGIWYWNRNGLEKVVQPTEKATSKATLYFGETTVTIDGPAEDVIAICTSIKEGMQ